jgi:pimeloyl-ACP methyl ester carboxylesterase
MKRAILTLTTLAAITALCGGCGGRLDDKFATAPRMERGLTIVLPGIEGQSHLNRSIRNGLVDGDVDTAIEIHDWTLGAGMFLVNQISDARARRKGEDLAGYIMAYKVLYPGRPVFLVAHSGGCAVATFAAEALPANESISGIVLLGPSISPTYDLTDALAHVDGKVINFYSPKDTGFLGVATTIFGTVDREHGSAAGRVGFRQPRGGDEFTEAMYRKLEGHKWEQAMALSGHYGGHTDWADRRFVRDYVAPHLTGWMRDLFEQQSAANQSLR